MQALPFNDEFDLNKKFESMNDLLSAVMYVSEEFTLQIEEKKDFFLLLVIGIWITMIKLDSVEQYSTT